LIAANYAGQSKARRKDVKRQFTVLVVVIASLISVQCGGSPPATEVPAATEAPATEAPATEAPTATKVPPTEAPAATEAPATEEVPTTLEGKALLEERCTRCHDLGRVERAKKTEEEWKATVERMVGKGAMLSQAEQELVIKYLTETYPK
jgi:cytochrome c5